MKNEKTGLFRAVPVADAAHNTGQVFYPRSTRRVPGNVPYLVDNLWEWLRPAHMPNRRFAAFASPTPELALASLSGPGVAFRVELLGDFYATKLAQLQNSPVNPHSQDAKFHRDCRALPRLLHDQLGHEFIAAGLKERQSIAALWTPCLAAGDVANLFISDARLLQIRRLLSESLGYWDDVELLGSPDFIPDPEGELLFEYPSGYRLLPLTA